MTSRILATIILRAAKLLIQLIEAELRREKCGPPKEERMDKDIDSS